MIPNADVASIPREKLTDYLLSPTHPIGAAKSRFFRAHGFQGSNLKMLEQGLLRIAATGQLVDRVSSMHGTKYVVDGTLETPSGRGIEVRTVWIVEADRPPRLITAYPA